MSSPIREHIKEYADNHQLGSTKDSAELRKQLWTNMPCCECCSSGKYSCTADAPCKQCSDFLDDVEAHTAAQVAASYERGYNNGAEDALAQTADKNPNLRLVSKTLQNMQPLVALLNGNGEVDVNWYVMHWDDEQQVWNRARYADIVKEVQAHLTTGQKEKTE